jgi:hypothetical protein
LSIFVVFILFVAVFVPITIQVYDYYINRKEGFFMLLETIFASSLLLATDETTHFTKERGGLDVHTTMQEQSIVPEPQTIRHHYVYYKSKQDVPKQIYYSKNGFRGMLTLRDHITAKGVQVEACYTGETIRC